MPVLQFVTELAAVNSFFRTLFNVLIDQMLCVSKASTFSLLSIYHVFNNERENKDGFN
jgi:hypothetical protein